MFIEIPASKLSSAKRNPIYGVGINDADYITTHNMDGKIKRCPFYVKWIHMIERCYSPKFDETNQCYRDCSVSEEWLVFSSFKKWMKSQDWKGKQIDKDLLVFGNKTYGKDVCVFVDGNVNTIISRFCTKDSPNGFYFTDNRYVVQCSINGIQKRFGRYKTKEEVTKKYKQVKRENIIDCANTQQGIVKARLIEIANSLINQRLLC